MFVGHYGVSFAAKAIDPALPLPALMVSTQLLDVAWSSLVLAGIEKVRFKRHFTATNDLDLYYLPYSHGLLTAAGWSVLAGVATYYLLPGYALFNAFLMGAVCFSHWLLDLLVHVPDLPLVGNRYKVGLGLWNRRYIALAVEIGILLAGAFAYADTLGGTGLMAWLVYGFAAALALVQVITVFGPPPTSVKAFAVTALGAYAVIAVLSRTVG